MINDIEEILIDHDSIVKKTKELGKQISEDYKDKNPLIIGLLKGCTPFMMELIQQIEIPLTMDFMTVSSYSGTSSGDLILKKDLETDVSNRDVIIVEDIVDTGRTLKAVSDMFIKRKAKSVVVATLLDKPEGRVVSFDAKYVGFVVPNKFVVGFGLDYNEYYRNLPFIGVLKKEIYEK